MLSLHLDFPWPSLALSFVVLITSSSLSLPLSLPLPLPPPSHLPHPIIKRTTAHIGELTLFYFILIPSPSSSITPLNHSTPLRS